MEVAVGILLPPLIDYLNKHVVSGVEKAWITVLTCFVVACLFDYSLLLHGTYADAKAILVLCLTLIGEAMTVYELFWKRSQLRVILPGNGIQGE